MTLAELFTALRSAPTPRAASDKTRAHYEYCTLWVLRLALDLPDETLLALPAGTLNLVNAEKFFVAAEAHAARLPDQAARARFLRSAYSLHSNAVNLVSRRACQAIRRLGAPDFEDWRDGRELFGRPLPAAPRSPLPDDATLRRTLTSWVNLAREVPSASFSLQKRNLFLAAGLELACGLRAGEVAQARWSWWTRHRHGPLLLGEAHVKNCTGRIEVVPVDPFWRVLNYWIDRHGWRGAPDDYVLAVRTSETVKQGNLRFKRAAGVSPAVPSAFECLTDRTFLPFRHCSDWLRGLGWQTQKTNHALRDFTASMLTMRYSLADAQAWCRHASSKTTERSYNRFVSISRRVAPRLLHWVRWAK